VWGGLCCEERVPRVLLVTFLGDVLSRGFALWGHGGVNCLWSEE